MKVVASNSPEQAAWHAFETAALNLHRSFANDSDTEAAQRGRRDAAIETAKRWDEWRKLFLGEMPGGAA